VKTRGRPAPFRAANLSDDLWLEVICQSNSEIAGSLRNIFRYSVKCLVLGVELLDECLGSNLWHLTKLRIPEP
jgi:hypothetical protein